MNLAAHQLRSILGLFPTAKLVVAQIRTPTSQVPRQCNITKERAVLTYNNPQKWDKVGRQASPTSHVWSAKSNKKSIWYIPVLANLTGKSELQRATFLVYNSHTLMSVNCNSWQSNLLNDALNLDWKKVDKDYSKDYKLRTFTQVYNLVHKRHTNLVHYTALFFWKIQSWRLQISYEKIYRFQSLPFWSVMKPILCKSKGMMVNVVLYATARVACIQMRARG